MNCVMTKSAVRMTVLAMRHSSKMAARLDRVVRVDLVALVTFLKKCLATLWAVARSARQTGGNNQRGADRRYDLSISLKRPLGQAVELRVPINQVCDHCHGTGAGRQACDLLDLWWFW